MLIDFDKIAETHAVDFRGGHGVFDRRIFEDPRVKIIYSTLRPGASTGLHRHEQNCEIMFVVSGEGHFYDNGEEEVLHAGQCHYCAMGHEHYVENQTDHDLLFLAIVAEHH